MNTAQPLKNCHSGLSDHALGGRKIYIKQHSKIIESSILLCFGLSALSPFPLLPLALKRSYLFKTR